MSPSSLSTAEAIALLSTGYISGLSISAGFVLSAIRQLYVDGESKYREWLWIIVLLVTITACSLAPIFLIATLVYGEMPIRPGFWLRMLIFVLGLLGGACFAFFSAHLFNKALRAHKARKE